MIHKVEPLVELMDKRELPVAKGSIFSEILMLGTSLVPEVGIEAI